jgi:hypothetical protein
MESAGLGCKATYNLRAISWLTRCCRRRHPVLLPRLQERRDQQTRCHTRQLDRLPYLPRLPLRLPHLLLLTVLRPLRLVLLPNLPLHQPSHRLRPLHRLGQDCPCRLGIQHLLPLLLLPLPLQPVQPSRSSRHSLDPHRETGRQECSRDRPQTDNPS